MPKRNKLKQNNRNFKPSFYSNLMHLSFKPKRVKGCSEPQGAEPWGSLAVWFLVGGRFPKSTSDL